MANIPIPYTFIADTIIDPDQMNANFEALSAGAVAEVGGELTSPILTTPVLNGNVTGSYVLTNGTFVVLTNADTGVVDRWLPALNGNTLIIWNGSSPLTVRSLGGGKPGQVVVIKNVGNSIARFKQYDGVLPLVDSFFNYTASAPTPIAIAGSIIYQHDGTRWHIVGHEQGGWIRQPFNAAEFTGGGGMTWTVEAGDVLGNQYRLVGNTLFVWAALFQTAIGGTPSPGLQQVIPGGFTTGLNVGEQLRTVIAVQNNGVDQAGLLFTVAGSVLYYYAGLGTTTPWAVGSAGVFVNFAFVVA